MDFFPKRLQLLADIEPFFSLLFLIDTAYLAGQHISIYLIDGNIFHADLSIAAVFFRWDQAQTSGLLWL